MSAAACWSCPPPGTCNAGCTVGQTGSCGAFCVEVLGLMWAKPSIKPGTRLVREWNGRTHHVEVLDKGFRWNDRTYRSLSSIAKAITGAHWSGPRFFGL
jgi:hypothetical protein